MRASFQYPSKENLDRFVNEKKTAKYNYNDVLGTKRKTVKGFDNDLNSILIGQGNDVWNNAKTALKNWQQFPAPWTKIDDNKTPLEEGNVVAVLFKLFGIWWKNSARIVYTFDEQDRFGFAYGTLVGHVEQGEECFWIDRDKDGNIYYHIKAFSKPDFWAAKIAYPIARRYQRKFVQESMATMKALGVEK